MSEIREIRGRKRNRIYEEAAFSWIGVGFSRLCYSDGQG